VITTDFDTQICVPAGYSACGYTFQTATCVDDILIAIKISYIDGPNGQLGRAGPCLYSGSPQEAKTRVGVMEFDSADVDAMITRGTFYNVVLHEMGHVLGLGTWWEWRGLIGGSPLTYQGAQGNIGNSEIGGPQGGAAIEEAGGQGTARAHFSESTYDSELMTGWAESGHMPMSRLTVRALMDLGYGVNLNAADGFTAPGGRRLRENVVRDSLKDDLLPYPITRAPEERPKETDSN
jgi:Leishmanolysin